MNAPMLVAGATVATGTAVIVTAQEVAAVVGAGRPTAEIIQIIGAIGVLIGIIGGIITPLVLAWVATKVKKAVALELAPVALAVAEVKTQGDVIKHSVDGTASRMEATLKSALQTIDQLRADKVDQKEIIIAQATAAPATAGITTSQAVLAQIETNTDATAKNTAKTDAAVTELKEKR